MYLFIQLLKTRYKNTALQITNLMIYLVLKLCKRGVGSLFPSRYQAAGEMAQLIVALAAFAETCSQHLHGRPQPFTPCSRGYDALFWSLQVLHAHGIQTHEGKYSHS